MKLRLRLYPSPVYQEDGATMEADIYQVELESDDGVLRYTIGRIFFSPEKLSELGRRVTLEILDELDEREVRNAG